MKEYLYAIINRECAIEYIAGENPKFKLDEHKAKIYYSYFESSDIRNTIEYTTDKVQSLKYFIKKFYEKHPEFLLKNFKIVFKII